jgi:hypothetical protein
MSFITRIDFSSNRQVKQNPETFTVLSGGTVFGVPFSALITGPDLLTSAVTSTQINLISTFSGNSSTTNYNWSNPGMQIAASNFPPLTPSYIGVLQDSGQAYTSFTTTIIDGNQVTTLYTGVSFDITVTAMTSLGGGAFSGTIHTNTLQHLSAGPLDYTGRTIWVDVCGITRTDRLLVNSLSTTGTPPTPSGTQKMVTTDANGQFSFINIPSGFIDIYVSGGTFSGGTATFTNTSGGTFNVTGFPNGASVTAFTYNNTNAFIIRDSLGGSFSASFNTVSGLTSTGTINTLSASAATLTANTIVNTDYIDFNTGATVSNKTGRLFYDNSSGALSYNPPTPANDVTLNIGQEFLIRIYNNTGSQINNGQAIIITGATSGAPTVTLATADGSKFLFQANGVATHNIPNNSYGFITNKGIVHDINLTAFTIGQSVFLSETTLGGYVPLSTLTVTGRTCEIGHVLDNSSLGSLLVTIFPEPEITNNTLSQLNTFSVNSTSTGVFQFSGLTTASTTTFNIAPVRGWIVDNETDPISPRIKYVTYPGATGITTPFLTSNTITYLYLTSGGTITQQPTFPTPQQRRQNIFLGKIGHAGKTTIINAFSQPDYAIAPTSQLRDMFVPIPLINSGVVASPNGANLSINTTSGTLYGIGISFTTNPLNPNSLSITANTPMTFQYRTQTGGTQANTTLVDPTTYDLNGVATTNPSGGGSATNQRIYLTQNGQFRMQYGQTIYTNLTNAVAGAATESFVTFSNFSDNAILIGILSLTKNATDLTDNTRAIFLAVSKFGEIGGGTLGISTTTLQQAYNNSAIPQIITSTALSAITIQRGSAADNDILLQFRNAAGATNATIDGNGFAKFIGLQNFSASTAKSFIVSGGTPSIAPFILATGQTLTTQTLGAIEYNGVNLFFTPTGTTRQTVLMGNSGATAPATTAAGTVTNRYGGATNFLGDPISWISVNLSGTTYKIPLY